jgi:thiol-disulfide isomerase/thioredoxin
MTAELTAHRCGQFPDFQKSQHPTTTNNLPIFLLIWIARHMRLLSIQGNQTTSSWMTIARRSLLTVPAFVSLIAVSVTANAQKLSVGDPSPGLKVSKWIKGDPVTAPLKDKVHVVEFWATWCGPCRVGMPHISELQNKYKDEVAFIGVTREDEKTVRGFLGKKATTGGTWDDVIQYRLALDEGDWTNTNYMRAAGQNGIPCAFVVGREGIIEWIGHPARIDEPLEKIVSGTWDREEAVAQMKQQQAMQQSMMKLSAALQKSDFDGALAMVDEMETSLGKSVNTGLYRMTILERAGRVEQATEVRGSVIEQAWEDSQLLNQIAWNTARTGKGNDADLQLALKAATRASELKEGKDAAILDTVARVYYVMGDLDSAIAWQEKAVQHNSGNDEIGATLATYKKEKAAQ